MFIDNMRELMHKHTLEVCSGEAAHKLWIVNHLELCCIFVDTNTSGRYGGSRHLGNPAGKSREERLRPQQGKSIFV
jgi:hypothetical protein